MAWAERPLDLAAATLAPLDHPKTPQWLTSNVKRPNEERWPTTTSLFCWGIERSFLIRASL